MSSLAVQLELKDSPDLLPLGIALVSFLQYLGASVVQVIAGAVFNNDLRQQLMWTAGLTPAQTSLLLGAGTRSVRDVTEQNFPELLGPVLEAYNSAITRVFVRLSSLSTRTSESPRSYMLTINLCVFSSSRWLVLLWHFF
jgi:hypothetical protein